MPEEIRFATLNVCNLALPGLRFYDNLDPCTSEEYDAKITWIARMLDRLDADVIGLQEIFSQAAVKDVLAKTEKYRQASHLGIEPDPKDGKLTPSVALISRLPIAGALATYTDLPRNLAVPLPELADSMTRFTRPILHAQVMISDKLAVNVFIVHLKSKRPDYRNGEGEDNQAQLGAAVLRSLIRRATEALGLRYLLTDTMQGKREPVVMMGDFNDVATAVTTQLVMGLGRSGKNGYDDRLFESYRIQSRRDPTRDVGFTHMHEGNYETIDHVLVSEDFNPASRFAIGEVLDVTYINDHVVLTQPEGSDHGAVLVRIRLFDQPRDNGDSALPPLDLSEE